MTHIGVLVADIGPHMECCFGRISVERTTVLGCMESRTQLVEIDMCDPGPITAVSKQLLQWLPRFWASRGNFCRVGFREMRGCFLQIFRTQP